MDQSHRPTTYRRLRATQPRREHPVFNVAMGLGFAVLGYIAFTPGAQGPGFGDVATMTAPILSASLSFSGEDVVITGSVEPMFRSGTFVGPNRGEKQNRARLTPDPLEFTGSFSEARLQLASLRAGAFDQVLIPQTVADPKVAPVSAPEVPPSISVASLGPSPASAALSAIDSVAPQPNAPMPVVLSDELAYARADAPVTAPVEATVAGKVVSEKELWCLAQAVYFEARGESYNGQVAVAQVVLNRLKHKLYPKTICGVVFQNQHMRNACQFSFACDGIPERIGDSKSWAQAEEIAKGAVQGQLYMKEVGKATHYHATYVRPHWAPRMKKLTKIGLHVFYQFKRNWRYG